MSKFYDGMMLLSGGRRQRWGCRLDECNSHGLCGVTGQTSQPRLHHQTSTGQDETARDQHRPGIRVATRQCL